MNSWETEPSNHRLPVALPVDPPLISKREQVAQPAGPGRSRAGAWRPSTRFSLVGGTETRDAKTARIVEAAKQLFLETPFDAVSMEAVAQAARVSKGTLYARFKGKEALFSFLMAEELHKVTDGLWSQPPRADGVERVLRRFAKDFVERIFSGRALDLFRIAVGEARRFPEFGAIFYQAGLRALIERLAAFLARCDREGRLHVPDPNLAATQFMSLVRADLFMRGALLAHAPEAAEVDRYIEAGVALFLAGHQPALRRRAGVSRRPSA